MKIGLLAFQNAINYGAVLQMYALKTRLENLGHEVEVIDYYCSSVEKGNKLKRRPYVSKKTKLRAIKKIYLSIEFFRNRKNWEEKYHKFEQFRNQQLNLSKKKYLEASQFNNIIDYDVYIVGSDQIWNPNITDGFDSVYFCDFASGKPTKKIAYAASCGSINTVKDNSKEFYKLIENFDHISAREKELSDFINKENKEKKSVRTLDPSLLLNADDYNKIAILPNEQDFLLIYKMQDNKELYKTAKKIAFDRGLKIIELGFPPISKDSDIKYVSDASPQEFLGYFNKASFVVTNSFHGTAFSLIYNKDFLTVPHRSVGQRMINLLNLLNLNGRIITHFDQLNETNLSKIHYEIINKELDREKKESLEYLFNSLSN